jgi:hypothetical protein
MFNTAKRRSKAALLGANTVRRAFGSARGLTRLVAFAAWTRIDRSGVEEASSAIVAALAANISEEMSV